MRLVTIQPYDAWFQLATDGRYTCNIAKSEFFKDENFMKAYAWMSKEMTRRIGVAPDGIHYPIWCWYKNDEDYAHTCKGGREYVKITIDVDPSRVLLSDFDDWNIALNGGPIVPITTTEEEADAEYDRIVEAGDDAIHETWARIFRTPEESAESDYVQGTIWEIRKEDLVEVTLFSTVFRKSESD